MGGTDHRQCGRMPDHQSYRSGRRNWGLASVGPPDALWADPAVLCAFASGQAIDPDPGAGSISTRPSPLSAWQWGGSCSLPVC